MKFKYYQFESPNKKMFYRPLVPVVFKCENKFVITRGLIDSGSDCTILPIEFAANLNIKIDSRKKINFMGAGKNSFTVYPSPVKVDHVLRQDGFRNIQWKADVYFAESQNLILLGHQGFLEKFKVILDGKRKETEIVE